MWLTMELRAVVVDMPFLKPCWCSTRLEAASIGPCRQLSSNLAAGERREIGLWLEPSSCGFPGFRRGMILAVFQRGE